MTVNQFGDELAGGVNQFGDSPISSGPNQFGDSPVGEEPEPVVAPVEEETEPTSRLDARMGTVDTRRGMVDVPAPTVSPERAAQLKLHEGVLTDTAESVKEFDSQFTFLQRQGNRLGVGAVRKQANAAIHAIGVAKNELEGIEKRDPDVLASIEGKLPPVGAFPTEEQKAEQLAVYTDNLRKLLSRTESEFTTLADAVENTQVENAEGEIITLPNHPVMQALSVANEAGDQELVNKLLKEFFPDVAAETGFTSLSQGGFAQVVAPAGTAIATKLATGSRLASILGFSAASGTVSAGVEYDSSFSEFLQEEGVDLTDVRAVEQALINPELVAKGRKFAQKRALSVGLWDMLGAYGAAKIRVPPGLMGKLTGQFVGGAAQITNQLATGAAGEATAQIATKGNVFSPLDVKLEAVGELPSAIAEPAVFGIANKLQKKPKDLLTPVQVLDAYAKNPELTAAETLEALKEVAQNGISHDEAVEILSALPNVDPDIVLNNRHLPTSQFPPAYQHAVRQSNFEDVDGNTVMADEIIDAAENTGRVVWANSEFTDNGGTIVASSTHMRVEAGRANVAKRERNLNIAQAEGAGPTTINTLSNELESGKEQLAKMERELATMDAVRPQLHALIQQMQQTFMPNQDIMIVEDNAVASGLNPATGSAGSFISENTGKRTQVIHLSTEHLLEVVPTKAFTGKDADIASILGTIMTHEFGHGLFQTLTANLPPAVIEAMQAEHRNWLAETLKDTNQSIGTVLGRKTNPLISRYDQIARPKYLSNPYTAWKDISSRPFAPTEAEYHLSFNEWVADAVARQLGGDTGALAPMTKKIAPRFAAILDRFKEQFADRMPDTTTPAFLSYIKAREQSAQIQRLREGLAITENNMPDATQIETIASMLENMEMPKEVKDQINNDMDKYNKIMRYGATLLQLGKANPHIKGLQNYIRAVHEHWVTKSNWNDQAMQTMNAWRKLGRKTADEVGRFLLERTVQSDELGRALTLSEQESMMKQEGMSFGDKADEARAVIDKIDADFNKALDSLYMIEKARINEDHKDFESQRRGKIAELDQTFSSLRDRNYFPLSRFGVWGISMKAKEAITIKGKSYAKGETLAMELFENKKQRNKAVGRLKRQFGPAIQETFFKVDETMEPFTGLPLSIMRRLKDNPKLGLTDDQKKKMLDMIDTLSPTQSIAKRMLERKGTAGFSRDAQRGYANYMMQIGGHLAKMQHVGEMDGAIQGIRTSANFLGTQGVVNDKRYEIAEHLQRHQEYIMNPVNEWAGMRALAFVWFLGYNVKSALVNLTQIPLVAYPYLAARKELTGGLGGKSDAIAIAELTKAMKDARQIFKFGGENIAIDEQNIIEQLVAEGIIDESLATELAGLAHGDEIQKMMPTETAFTDNVQRGSKAFLRGSTWMFQTAEKFNRRAVALATIRLAKKKGMNPEQQLDEAREALRTTQFEYARWNRAAFMRGKAGVFFVFMQYLQNILSFTIQDPGRTRYLLMLLMAAGLQGLPGAEDLLDFFDFAGRNLKKMGRFEGDPRTDTREALRETIQTLNMSPELIMHGLSAQSFGFGMSGVNDMLGTSLPSLTFEGSVSAGRIIPGWESLMNGREVGLETAKDVAGAAITIPMNILQWTRDEDPSSVRSLERMAPSVLKGALKSFRGWQDEGLTDRSGNELVDFDMNNPEHIGELIGMSLGAQPTRLTRENERRWAIKEAEMYYATMRQNMQKDYNYAKEEARRSGDTELVGEAVETIKWFNRNVPRGQQLTNYGQAYARWRVSVAKDGVGVGRRILDLPLRDQINSTFPAAEEERIR